jgi:hypothetical protein
MFTKDQLGVLLTPVSSFELSIRCKNALLNNNMDYFANMLTISKGNMWRLPNFGIKSFEEIKNIVEEKGFKAGSLSRYSGDLPHDRAELRTFLSDNLVVAKEDVAGDFGEWVKGTLSAKLKDALTPETLESVLNDPKVRRAVAGVVKGAITKKLGLDGGP